MLSPIVQPPTIPPSNKTEEPVTSPPAFTLNLDDDIKKLLSFSTDELIKNGHIPRLLVRNGSEQKVMQTEKCEIVIGDIHNDDALNNVLESCDAVIYLIALIREFPKKNLTNEVLQFKGSERVAAIAEQKGVKRFLLMSALGASPDPDGSKYMQAKHLSEQAIKNTKLDWTIIRPSSLFGDPRGGDRPEFCMMLDKLMLSLVPYPKFLPFPAPSFFTGMNPLDAGSYALSMIHVKDVATLFVKILEDEESKHQTIEIGGNRILENSGGFYMEPTIISSVKQDTNIFQNEVFGPVLTVTSFASESEAVELSNATAFGLASGIWTSNLSKAHRMIRKIKAGTVFVNTYGGSDNTLLLTGVKQSGNGSDKSLHALDKFTDLKSVWMKL